MVGLDSLPKSILFYRQQLQWLGGIGIIVLAVAIFPLIGIGGMQLYQTESPGPNKENKLTPRITETARALWLIYVSLTALCAFAYWFAGMDAFDAICHSFSTIAIGGFSTHDLSLGYFDNAFIELVAVFFMIIAGINFGLHFFVWQRKNPFYYLEDSETKAYLLYIFIGSILVCGLLWNDKGVVAGLHLCLEREYFRPSPWLLRPGFPRATSANGRGVYPLYYF